MKKIFCLPLILGIITVFALLSACGDDDSGGSVTTAASTGARLNVVATTVQITALTSEVGGDMIQLKGIIPAGADPHEFEPTASDLQAIENADVILRHGMGLDDWLDDTLSAGHNDATTVTTGIVPLKADEDGKTVDDPHVWHDPANDKIMVENIAQALESADSSQQVDLRLQRQSLRAEAGRHKERGSGDHRQIPANSRKMVTDHDAFGYFAQRLRPGDRRRDLSDSEHRGRAFGARDGGPARHDPSRGGEGGICGAKRERQSVDHSGQ